MQERNDTVLDELRAELAAARTSSGPDAARREQIVDAWVVRHPHRAETFRALLGEPQSSDGGGGGGGDDVTKGPAGNARFTDAPRSLGSYHLIRELGRGGMGIVYLARDEKLHRLVAVKILPRSMAADVEMLDRFQREAAAVTELEHPAIVPIFEIGEDSGIHYYAMGYVDGSSLKEFSAEQLRRRDVERHAPDTLRPRTAVSTWRSAIPGLGAARARGLYLVTAESLGRILDVVEQIARALDHAHQHEILHRDVKPSNIMVDREGSAHLLDFGLAKFLDNETATQSGRLLGTVPYMAPEQLSSRHGPVDHRADVYALGVTLYESVTGTRPFQGESHEALMFQAIMKPAPSPCLLVPELSKDIETVILKCLEKNPERRYQSCAALAEDLERIRAHKRIEAAPIGAAGRLVRWAERNRAVAAVAAAVVLITLTIPVIGVWGEISAARERRRAAEAELDRASGASERHAGLVLRLDEVAVEAAALRDQVETHEEATSTSKTRLLALREERRRALAELDGLELAAMFAWNRARELGADDGGAIESFLRRLHDDAWRRRDEARAREVAAMMRRQGLEAPPVPEGLVSLRSFPSGASVRVHRYVEQENGVLIPDATPVLTGATPVESAPLPCGSYVAVISAPDRIEVRYPFVVEPQQHWGHPTWHGGLMGARSWKIELPAAEAFDATEWTLVPRGPYLATADRDALGGAPDLEWRWLDDFVIARREATFGDYRGFFERDALQRAIEESLRDQKARWFPRQNRAFHAALSRRHVGRRWVLDINSDCLDWPLTGLSPPDARDFAAWIGEREGVKHALPTSHQWEKAARGVDGRTYPWGWTFDPSFTSCKADQPRWPDPAGSFAVDTSPYGAVDMAGNVEEWCADGPPLRETAVNPYVAGGSLVHSDADRFSAWSRAFHPFDGSENFARGFRLIRSAGER